jgi:uncharacterized protein
MLVVRLTPKSSRDAVTGLTAVAGGQALSARVRAAPEKGAANDALERLVADWLGVPRMSVAVEAGGKSRVKSVSVSGDTSVLEHRIVAAVAGLPVGGGTG